MKKTFFLGLLLCSLSIYAQVEIFEGYDNLPWGTSVDVFITTNPEAYEDTSADDKLRNERIFIKDSSTGARVYRFFKNKLYWGRTVFNNPTNSTAAAILEKFIETYGKFDDMNSGTDTKNRKYLTAWVNVSDSLNAVFESYENLNLYGQVTSTNIYITTEDTKVRKEVDLYEKEQKKKDIEL